jgi:hypothetical protein
MFSIGCVLLILRHINHLCEVRAGVRYSSEECQTKEEGMHVPELSTNVCSWAWLLIPVSHFP